MNAATRLERLGIFRSARQGASRRYSVDPGGPARGELSALVRCRPWAGGGAPGDARPCGLETAFIAASLPLSDIERAAGEATIPLVLIGEIQLEEIDAAQERVSSSSVFRQAGSRRSSISPVIG